MIKSCLDFVKTILTLHNYIFKIGTFLEHPIMYYRLKEPSWILCCTINVCSDVLQLCINYNVIGVFNPCPLLLTIDYD